MSNQVLKVEGWPRFADTFLEGRILFGPGLDNEKTQFLF